jgi:hypothetical protein
MSLAFGELGTPQRPDEDALKKGRDTVSVLSMTNGLHQICI